MNAFMKMSKKDQESYLDLHNKFDSEKDTWSSDMKQKYSEWQNLIVPKWPSWTPTDSTTVFA